MTQTQQKTFNETGSLEILWSLIKRHQMFLMTTVFVVENIYLLVTQFN